MDAKRNPESPLHLQKDLSQLTRSRDLFIALNSKDEEEKSRAIRSLSERPEMETKGRSRKKQRRNSELIRLVKEQRADEKDRRIRFEHAIHK